MLSPSAFKNTINEATLNKNLALVLVGMWYLAEKEEQILEVFFS
jgi:hypothetical protein